jgi:hypothetical protein
MISLKVEGKMKTVFRAAVAAMLLALPMAAQIRQISWISFRIGQQGGSSCLLYVGKASDPLHKEFQKLTETKELADIGLVFESIQAATPRYESLAKALGLARSSTWALADRRGRCLLQGSQMPTALELKNALQEAGVKNPIKEMRDFLKQHPSHLEARAELMARLRAAAERRTKQALQLNIKTPIPEEFISIRTDYDWTDMYSYLSRSAVVDTSPMEGKQLEPEEDTLIWGPYAQELNETFASGDWRLMPMPQVQSLTPIEVCSPLMALTYRRNLSKIEDCLEEFPSNAALWKYYGWASAVAKRKAARAVIERLVAPPRVLSQPPTMQAWPVQEAMSLLVAEEREKENWAFLADTLMARWPKARNEIMLYSILHSNESNKEQTNESNKEQALINKALKEVVWQDYLCPLLESLIKANRVQEAETILLDAMKYPPFKEFQSRAADLANSCGDSNLRTKWTAFYISEQKQTEQVITNIFLEMVFGVLEDELFLVAINANNHAEVRRLQAELLEGRLVDWRLHFFNNFPDEISEWLRQKHGWQGSETMWALLGSNYKTLGQGPGLPSTAALLQAIEGSGIETPASIGLRFIKQHPSNSEAREMLLRELKRVAEQKTKEAIGAGAGVDVARLLSDEEDHAIWWDYFINFRQALSSALERGRITSNAYNFASEYFIHSPLMKNLAHIMLPQVEACLQCQPTDVFLWMNWVSLSGLSEHRPFRTIKETLVLAPMSDPLNDLPPLWPRSLLLQQYLSRSNWQGVLDLQEWRWDGMKDGLESDPSAMNDMLFQDCLSMLEAYLRLGREGDANALFEFWAQHALSRPSSKWATRRSNFAAVAKECGKLELAERWKK